MNAKVAFQAGGPRVMDADISRTGLAAVLCKQDLDSPPFVVVRTGKGDTRCDTPSKPDVDYTSVRWVDDERILVVDPMGSGENADIMDLHGTVLKSLNLGFNIVELDVHDGTIYVAHGEEGTLQGGAENRVLVGFDLEGKVAYPLRFTPRLSLAGIRQFARVVLGLYPAPLHAEAMNVDKDTRCIWFTYYPGFPLLQVGLDGRVQDYLGCLPRIVQQPKAMIVRAGRVVCVVADSVAPDQAPDIVDVVRYDPAARAVTSTEQLRLPGCRREELRGFGRGAEAILHDGATVYQLS